MDLLLLRQYLNPINYELLSKCSSEHLWQISEILPANGDENARAIAKTASIIACEGELDKVKFLSK